MAAVWMWFRIELRSRWRGWLTVALLAGIAGGLVVAAAAGARRTDSALARHLAAYRFQDAMVGVPPSSAARIRALPQVQASALDGELFYCARDAENRPVTDASVVFTVNVDGHDGVALHRPKILAGRIPDLARPREVVLDRRAAARFGVGAGGVIPIRVFPRFDSAIFRCDPRNPSPVQRGIPERREVRQILLACTSASECQQAKLRADRLYARLRAGASFARLAGRYSAVPDARVTGGKLWVERGAVAVPDGCCHVVRNFERIAFRLRTRELSRPLKTRFGWHIVQPISDVVAGGRVIRLRVVGVKATTDPFPIGTVELTPAFYRAYGFDSVIGNWTLLVRLRRSAADIPAFRAAVGTDVGSEADNAAKIQSSIHHQAQALWLAAGFGALLVVLLLAPALLRLAAPAAVRHGMLTALGMTRRQLVAVDIVRAASVGTLAAGVAVTLALALSPLTPIGLARDLEPDSGFAFDPVALAVGGAGVVLAVVVVGALASSRGARAERPERRRSATASVLARWRLPASAVSGVRLALTRGSGMTAVPIAGTVLAAVAAVGVVAVALTFTASLDHLFSTPRLYGRNWDYRTAYDVPPAARVRADPTISDAARGDETAVLLNGRRVGAVAMDDIKGSIGPIVTEGRRPERTDEIVLSAKTLDALGLRVGDRVEARGTRPLRMRIVGRAVLPEGRPLNPREGAALTFQAFKRLNPGARPIVFEARIAPDADREATLARLERAHIAPAPGPPKTVADFEAVRALPVVVSALLAAIAAATLAYTLVAAIRRRRRHLAVLKTLGFDRRQLLATVAWQGTTFAVIGLVVGLPLGVAAGRWAWWLFAEQIDVIPEPVTPVPLLLLVVPAALLLAVAVAALPAASAARTRAAVVLRAE